MPSFSRLGKLSNRSQHNLAEQQQQQQQQQQWHHQQHHQQQLPSQLRQQPSTHQQHQHQHQHGSPAPSPATLATAGGSSSPTPGIGLALSGDLNPETPRSSSTIAGVAGVSSISTPPSASSTALSSSESFHQYAQDTRAGQPPLPQQQQQQQQQLTQPIPLSLPQTTKQRNRLSQHFFNNHSSNQGPPQGLVNHPNPISIPNLSPASSAAAQLQHHNPVPLNQPTTPSGTTTTTTTAAAGAAYTARPQQQQQQHQHHHQHQHQHSKQQQQSPLPPLPPKSELRDNFVELVSRSHSARQSQPQVTPIQTQQPYVQAASSADNLPQTGHLTSPIVPSGQTAPLSHSQTAPTEQKRSARRLLKNIILSAARNSEHQHQGSHDNTIGLGRRSSKRLSNPPTVRTDPSQVSFEEQQRSDWQPQDHYTQPSPLQGVGEIDESHLPGRSNQDILRETHQAQDPLQNTIRRIPADVDTSPYGQEDLPFQHQQQTLTQHQAQAKAQTDQQQQLYGQIVVDPAQNQYQFVHPPEAQYQANRPSQYVGLLRTSTSHLSNPETVSQLSHESPVTDSDQPINASSSQQASPAVNYSQQELLSNNNRQQAPSPATQSQTMVPPPPAPASNRRPGESKESLRGLIEPPAGPPPNFRHSQAQMGATNNLPQAPATNPNNQNYRSSTVTERQQFDGSSAEGGRNSPQPDRESDPDKQFKDLLTKYKNVKRLYFDGKTHIEQLGSQVEQLQNAVANQRMSQSRTALDDNEYSTRFNRLNGAIVNLAFNIRKDWRSLPPWIERYVSADAIKTGKQEMTAVGRAVITRWVVEEIFNKCFHPGLDGDLSCHLKVIEQNIRRGSYTFNSQEEYEALTSKVVHWRMATLEGLQHMLQSPQSNDYRADFTKMAGTNLTAALYQFLNDPPPPGVDGSASMIVELAVGIAANLPLESRDVAIMYPLPEDTIRPDVMEPEKSALPPLAEPPEDAEDSGKDGDKASKRDKTKSGMLTKLGGTQHAADRKGSTASILTDTTTTSTAPPPKDPTKVRFAGFLGVDVRGRQVLVKAPVWTLG